jgi:hypothetical protein
MTVKVEGLFDTVSNQLASITVSGVIDDVSADSIAIYSGATVPTWRQLEVVNAWKRAWDGARDRNIMQQFAGIWYSGYDIDHIDEADRITISTFASFGDNDVFIGMSADVCIDFHDAVNMIEVAFDQLRNTAMEQYLKVA